MGVLLHQLGALIVLSSVEHRLHVPPAALPLGSIEVSGETGTYCVAGVHAKFVVCRMQRLMQRLGAA